MAQLNITLNQDEILQLLSDNRDEAFKALLQNSLNSILKAESAEQLKAAPYERTDERTDNRNGTRERTLATRLGKLELQVPRHRNQPFKTMIFENYSRSEAALITTMAEMVVNGVSTRKISQVMETLCGTSYSKSSVSELCKELDSKISEFRKRPLTGEYPFLIIDATYFRVRENHRIVSKAFMTAFAVDAQGRREIQALSDFRAYGRNLFPPLQRGCASGRRSSSLPLPGLSLQPQLLGDRLCPREPARRGASLFRVRDRVFHDCAFYCFFHGAVDQTAGSQTGAYRHLQHCLVPRRVRTLPFSDPVHAPDHADPDYSAQ